MWATFCHRDLPAKAGSLLKIVINLVLLPFYSSLKYLLPVTRKRQAKDPDIGQSVDLKVPIQLSKEIFVIFINLSAMVLLKDSTQIWYCVIYSDYTKHLFLPNLLPKSSSTI